MASLPENVERVVQQAAVILDAVDVTTKPRCGPSPPAQSGQKYRKPILAGYDIAGLQMMFVFNRYRNPTVQVMNGRGPRHEIENFQPFDFLYRVIFRWPVRPAARDYPGAAQPDPR